MVGLRASMGNRLGIKAMVLTIGMLAGCETAIPNPRGSRLLTGSEMDQITAGSVGAINRAEAHARGLTSQATASTSTLVASRSGTIVGVHLVNAASSNYVSSQLSASAGNGQTATASGSNHVYADGEYGVTQIDEVDQIQPSQDGVVLGITVVDAVGDDSKFDLIAGLAIEIGG